MPFTVFMLQEAEQDLEGIYKYIRDSGNAEAARKMLGLIQEGCESLSEDPERGFTPDELSRIGNYEYRQIIVKPYRIIYQIVERNVFIFGIIHGRRNLQAVLKQRLLFSFR